MLVFSAPLESFGRLVVALLICAWALIALLSTYGVYLYWRRVARKLQTVSARDVVLIIPIKGAHGQTAALDRFFASCLGQAGISYRVIFAVESEKDPAVEQIARLASTQSHVSLVVAGQSIDRGQKVHNQHAALATLRSDDRYVVFADADVVLPPDWLAQLLRPILLGHAELASGYRWILPADDHLGSRLCALIDWGVATAPRDRRWNTCWGGSMAITRTALDRIDLQHWWAGTVSDDIMITRAARHAGIAPYAPHAVLVPTPVRHDLRSLFDFGSRQYLLGRVYGPRHWRFAGLILILPTIAGIAAAVAAMGGSVLAMVWLACAAGLQQLRVSLRVRVAARVLDPDLARQSATLVARDRWLLPLAHLIHLAIWLRSGLSRHMVWAGIRYRLLGPNTVEVLSRPET